MHNEDTESEGTKDNSGLVGYNVANAPPCSRDVEHKKSKVGGREEEDEGPG